MKGWKDKFSVIDRRAISDAMAWRHHDSDVNDRLSPHFKYTGGNAITMSEYLCFPFLFGVSIGKGTVIFTKDRIEENTTLSLPIAEPIPNKTESQLVVEVKDPKEEVFLSKSNAGGSSRRLRDLSSHCDSSIGVPLSKSREVCKGLNIEEGESSCPREIYVLEWGIPRRCRVDSLMWCRDLMVHLAPPYEGRHDPAEKVIDLGLVHSGLFFSAGLATVWDFLGFHLIFKYTGGNDRIEENTTLSLPIAEPIPNKTESQLEVEVKDPKEEVFLSKSNAGGSSRRLRDLSSHCDSSIGVPLSKLREVCKGESSCPGEIYVLQWGIPRRCRVDSLMWCRDLMVHLAPPVAQEESNALTNSISLNRA
nr:hypothetical protein [Tanacetum cinerariifolium]